MNEYRWRHFWLDVVLATISTTSLHYGLGMVLWLAIVISVVLIFVGTWLIVINTGSSPSHSSSASWLDDIF